jgi:hypothetical protein
VLASGSVSFAVPGATSGSACLSGTQTFCAPITGEQVSLPQSLPDGTYTITVVVFDQAGNRTERTWTFTVDTRAPTTTATPSPDPNAAGWHTTAVSVALAASDGAAGSGVKEISYTLAGAQTGGAVVAGTSASVPVSAAGITTLTYSATDNAGNTETARALTIRIDPTPPDTSITSAVDGGGGAVASGGSTVSSSLTVTFIGTDSVGVAGFECSLDGAAFSAASCTSPTTYTGLAPGGHTLRVRAKDTAGNLDPTPASRNWTIATPAQGTQTLIATIGALPLPGGTRSSLTAPLDTAAKRLTDGNPSNDTAACANLDDFKAKVADQLASGKLTAQQAADLTKAADAIKRAQGCP